MKKTLRYLNRILAFLGLDLRKTCRALRSLPSFYREYSLLKKQSGGSKLFAMNSLFPCLGDRFSPNATVFPEYFYQDLLVTNMIFRNNPEKHVDIGSRVDGFVACVSSFRPVEVFDIRRLDNIKNITFIQTDFTDTSNTPTDYCDSLSCLHALEHFGLGRYGDPICYDGHLKGLENMYKILRSGGKFYISIPIGPQRIEFNAHRVFSVAYMLEQFNDRYTIDSFSYIADDGSFHENVELTEELIQNNCNCHSGCGIFELTKV